MKAALLSGFLLLACAAAPAAAASGAPSAHTPNERAALVERLADSAGGPSRQALEAAVDAYENATRLGEVARTDLLTVIDYTRPSTEPRLWVLDLDLGRILYRELVAHGRGSGDNLTRAFSNAPGSLMTSLGLFVTDAPYVGQNGYSLRLRGLEPGVNDKAFERAIVVRRGPVCQRVGGGAARSSGPQLGMPCRPPGRRPNADRHHQGDGALCVRRSIIEHRRPPHRSLNVSHQPLADWVSTCPERSARCLVHL